MTVDTTTLRTKLQSILDAATASLALLPAPAPVSPVPLSYNARTDRTISPKPSVPAFGPAGSTIIDPTFSTKITRITDGTLLAQTSCRTPSNLTMRAWSCDGNMFYVTSTQGTLTLFDFDPTTGKATPNPITLPFFGEPDFHPSKPGVLTGAICSGAALQLATYDVAAKQLTVLLDLTAVVPAINLLTPRTYVRDVAVSQTGRGIALFGGTGQDHDYLIAVQTAAGTWSVLNTLAGTLDGKPAPTIPMGWNWHVHSAWLDQSGRYVTINGIAGDKVINGGLLVWDIDGNTIIPWTTVTGGHVAVGYGKMINQAADSPYDDVQWQTRSFSALTQPQALINPVLSPKAVGCIADHTSWHNSQPNFDAPAISGIYRYRWTPQTGVVIPSWRAWDDELLALGTGSEAGTVWRLAHHRSNLQYADPTGTDPTKPYYFWSTPRPQVSPNGCWVLFTSNWEQTLGIDPHAEPGGHFRQDVFLLALPLVTQG